MTKALVMTFLMCWGPSDSECSVMTKEVDSIEACIQELAFIYKDVTKMRLKGNKQLRIEQFACKRLD